MSSARPLVTASLVGLAAAAALGTVPVLRLPGRLGSLDWGQAHMAVSLAAFLLPAFAALHLHTLERILGRAAPVSAAQRVAVLWLAGGGLWGLGHLLQPSNLFAVVAFVGTLVLVAAGVVQMRLVAGLLPKGKQSVVDVARDPLTKGDDASLQHIKFAHMLLPLALLLVAAAYAPGLGGTGWETRLRLAGLHLLLAGHVLLSCYGLAHLWVPRLSGVPAIAAGAIKGELHTSRLALLLLVAGFLVPNGNVGHGLLIAGGAFAFLGAFTFMGVIGANIMRNKSKTQRITPEFTYIPWAFTAVFWLMSGVLLGIFLNVIPQVYASQAAALRFTHVHIALLGGAAQLVLALAYRIVPQARGVPPPPFHEARWGYWGINLGLALLIAGRFGSWPRSNLFMIGSVLILLGLAASFISLVRHGRVAGTTG